MSDRTQQTLKISLAFLTTIVLGVISGLAFHKLHVPEPLYPSPALTKVFPLSNINPNLKGTSGDTDVYLYDSGVPGGSLLILGGTHPNEVAGYLAAVVMLENLQVEAGRVYIIPRANNSAFTHNEPQEAHPQQVLVETADGPRRFRYGARVTNPVDQWPDPEIYRHPASGSILAGNETRNLNRTYPGLQDGTLTEQVAWAITEMIRQQQIDLSFDLHEAAPEYPVVNAIIASERSQDIASIAAITLQLNGLEFSLEPSPYNFRGLSHREWTNYTETLPILLETANPSQGRLRGRTNGEMALSGRDHQYERAAKIGALSVPFDSTGISAEERVARNLEAIMAIVDAFNMTYSDKPILLGNLPHEHDLLEKRLGAYLTGDQ